MGGAVLGGSEAVARLVDIGVASSSPRWPSRSSTSIIPRVQVAWGDVWIGAVVTALLFTIGKLLIGLYIGKSGVASGFGAAGSWSC